MSGDKPDVSSIEDEDTLEKMVSESLDLDL
jgi:hypothetical protein